MQLNCAAVQAQPQSHYDIRLVDPNNRLASDREPVMQNLRAALNDWARYIPNVATLQVEVRILDKTISGRFGGRAESAVWLEYNGEKVLEECTTHKLRTGEDTNGYNPDVIIEVQPEFMRKSYWIDPEPFIRTTPVTIGKIDLVTVFAHEIGHALGLNGRLDRMTGQLPPGQSLSQFDAHIVNRESSEPAFRGDATSAVYGGELPLSLFNVNESNVNFTSKGKSYYASVSKSQNFYHYGRFTKANESPLSLFGLMAGGWPYPDLSRGLRIPVGKLDVAILQDLGVPTK